MELDLAKEDHRQRQNTKLILCYGDHGKRGAAGERRHVAAVRWTEEKVRGREANRLMGFYRARWRSGDEDVANAWWGHGPAMGDADAAVAQLGRVARGQRAWRGVVCGVTLGCRPCIAIRAWPHDRRIRGTSSWDKARQDGPCEQVERERKLPNKDGRQSGQRKGRSQVGREREREQPKRVGRVG